MTTVEERVIQMKFQNAAFQQNVQQTISSLTQLNKALQLQGATNGMKSVSTVAQQLDQHMVRSRNSLGQFTSAVSQTSTITTTFAQKIEAGRENLSKLSPVFSSVVSHAQNFGQKIVSGTSSLGHFLSEMSKSSSAADKQAKSLKNVEGSVSSLASRFTALGSIATGALLNIGARAQEAGTRLLNSFTFAPLTDGFHEYETNLNSIQTILANTQAAGTTLKDVNHTLEELNHYSDQTIYNFAEMAKNIGTFTAAGVDLKTSTAAIKGIANLAALSGSNSEQASGAMYQLSQAISAGRVSLEDWNSVVNAGMGGTVFQRALAQNAERLGTLSKGAVELKGKMKNVTIEGKSFRESITAKPGEESWLTSKVLTDTLSQFTGDLTDAQLAAAGFNKEQIKAIQAQAKTAKAAATEVKTATQLFGTFKEQLGSGWAQTWQTIFGDFTEAKGLFTGVSESIGGLLQKSSDARNKMLSEWDKLGGRTALIDALSNTFNALLAVAKPIREAFREIFPATTGKQLADMTKNFRDFTERLKIGSETADKLKRTFAGVFAVFGIAIDIVKGFLGVIFDLVGQVTKGSGGVLDFTAKIGDFLVALRNGIREGEGLTNFFKGLSSILAVPIKLIQKFVGFLGSMFKDTDSKGVEKSVENISSKLEPLGRLGDVVSAAWEKTLTVMKNVGQFFKDLGAKISNVFKSMGIDFASMFQGFDTETLFAGLDTGLLAGLFLIVRKFLNTFSGGAGGIFEAISDGISDMTGSFSAMQNTLKAATLLQIAIAIGVLAVSMNILAKIDPDDLTKASAAITVMFAQLLGAMTIFQKFIGFAGFAKLPFIMGSLILLAGAVLILSQAVKQLAGLDWNELAKGLTGLAVTLGLVVGALKFMPNPKGLVSTGLGLIVLAAAIKILASAVSDLSELGWNELSKGLTGVAVLLGTLTLFTMFSKVNKGGIAQGAGIVLLAAGIKILASAVKDMSKMSWQEIAKGLVTLAGALGVITGALMLIPPSAAKSAIGVLGVAISLSLIAKALDKMAGMNWGEIGKSVTVMTGALAIIAGALYIIPPTAPQAAIAILGVAYSLQLIAQSLSKFSQYSWEEIGKAMTMLAGTLGIIAGAMFLMTGALPGAAATVIVAGALAILAPILEKFGQMSLEEIGKSLLMLAGVFGVFGLAAILLTPVIPVMIGLGVAVGILGVGLLAAGAGVLLFATGLTVLAGAGAAATAAVVGIVAGLIGLIPEVMKQIGLGLIAFAKVIATAGPAITKALTVVLTSLIDAIVKIIPKVVDALYKLLSKLIETAEKYIPKMVDTGLKLLTGFLRGIANNIGKVSEQATRVVVNFLNAISRDLPKVIDAGVKMVISFVNGVANAIRENSAAMNAAGRNLGSAIVEGMIGGLASGLGSIASAAKDVASSALDAAKGVLGINSPSKEFIKIGKFVMDGFRKGLDGNKAQVYDAFNDLKKMLLDLSKSTKASAAERKKAASAYNTLTKQLNDEKTQIGKLATQYDKLTVKIKAAQDTYANAVKMRDDYKKSVTDQYSDIASVTEETTVASFKADLEKQIEDTKKFANTLARLRKLGLNDEMYKDLLASGTDALPFAEELLKGGKSSINDFNKLGKELDKVGASLGKSASTALYQAGVDSAAGLVKGLQAQQKNLEKIMDKLAVSMVNAIKKKLGIKSPAVEMMKIGVFSAEGLIEGLVEMSASVDKAAAGTGSVAVEALRRSMSGFSDLITQDLATRPVITPVLDLSGIKENAGQINGILNGNPISVSSSYAKARTIADAQLAARTSAASDQAAGSSFNYTQNNYSPKALSQAEIYRQTNNQLSKVKGALSTNAG